MRIRSWILGLLLLSQNSAHAAQFQRWTYQQLPSAGLGDIITELNKRTGWNFQTSDFQIAEDRPLAYTHYQRWQQLRAGLPIAQASLRIWTTSDQQQALQVEASVEDSSIQAPLILSQRLKNHSLPQDRLEATLLSYRNTTIKRPIRSERHQRAWEGNRLAEQATFITDRGTYELSIDVLSGAIIRQSYRSFPQVDPEPDQGLSLPSLAYPVYEEFNGQLLAPVAVQLKYLNPAVQSTQTDPFSSLKQRRYLGNKLDRVLGNTVEGQEQGYWNFDWLTRESNRIKQGIPLRINAFAQGLLLDGKYATINIHPNALAILTPLPYETLYGGQFNFDWKYIPETQDFEVVPSGSLAGHPWFSSDALARPIIERHPQHDPKTYAASGFDEIQVYYAVNALFESLRPMGFLDPDLAERPFHAFLYNPDIESRDNAYYSNDTINFSTYSPYSGNLARDNTTIWHELGHGLMDRLMGPELNLADTGGLSEGMADFVAQLVLTAQTFGQSFPGQNDLRIFNQTGFFLTNEVHDDGEAYGGAMKAIMDAAISQHGRRGLTQVSDLILEAMRFSRDNPHLTAEDWFERVRFTDQIGRPGLREPGEMKPFIDAALTSRNFAPAGERVNFSLSYAGQELDAGQPGTRDNEIAANIGRDEIAEYELKFDLQQGSTIQLRYPLTVKVSYDSWALQGALAWIGEDAGPLTYTLHESQHELTLPLGIYGRCDYANRDQDSCSDYAYVEIFESGATQAVAKKRFYVRLMPEQAAR